ncbi:TetR/AcrR family transcriptional regulator [Paenibacillus albidus]|uniref:TetR/AcrR family transcriptional regulator n=1 Tax=Paenibacillus albidus TaxID=2041023 RepID=UPI001BE6ADB9|nr:TetR/AcrR family transcriptional regulator [Paenibacillus albidus]MBT2292500.1 TetR/AcrR family transcriptional regulator [Paenibacillus albidus]
MTIKKREITSNQIIQAAYELFAEYGVERTSLGMISKKVGITKSSIYYHFDSKEELISRTFDHIFKDHYFATYFNIASVNRDTFVETLYEGGLKMLPSGDEEHRSTLRVLSEFMMLAERDEQFRTPLLKVQQDFVSGFFNLLAKGSELGLISPSNIESKSKILALLIDNLSRCKMMKFEMEYPEIWKEAVYSMLIQKD